MKEFIICSAIHFSDDVSWPGQPDNIHTGIVISGRRHKDCYTTLQLIGKILNIEGLIEYKITDHIGRFNQGFITNLNRYVDRKEGMKIAKEANQLIRPDLHKDNPNAILTSEDLW